MKFRWVSMLFLRLLPRGRDFGKAAQARDQQARQLEAAAREGDAASLARLIAAGADPRWDNSRALVAAAYNGWEDCVRILTPLSDARADGSAALQMAVCRRHPGCVKLLLGASNPKANESYALRLAAHYGLAECLRLLLPVSDAKAHDSAALWWAAQQGRVECLKMLLPVSDPKAGNSRALGSAGLHGHAECVRLLLPVSDAAANDSAAIRGAARFGHVECVRLLAASRPLAEIDGLLEDVIKAGGARMAALLIEEEPRLLDGVNLSKCLAAAIENERGEMASYLSSLIDKKELLGGAAGFPTGIGGRSRL